MGHAGDNPDERNCDDDAKNCVVHTLKDDGNHGEWFGNDMMMTKIIAIMESGLVVILACPMMTTMMMMILMTKIIAIMVSGLAVGRIQRRCSGTLRFAIRELTRH